MATSALSGMWNGMCSPVSKFWGEAVVPGQYDFSPCFEDTVLLITPCVLLLISATVRFALETVSSIPLLPLSVLHVCRTVLTCMVGVVSLTQICRVVYEALHNGQQHVALYQYISPSCLFLTTIVAICLLQRDRNQGIRSSGSILIYWLLMTAYGAVKFRTYLLIELFGTTSSEARSLFQFVVTTVSLVLFVSLLIVSCIPDREPLYMPVDDDRDPNPEAIAPFLSQISFWWMNKLVMSGYRRPLVNDDLFGLLPEMKASIIVPRFMSQWRKQVQTARDRNSSGLESWEEMRRGTSITASVDETSTAMETDSIMPLQAVVRRPPKKYSPSLFEALARAFGWTVVVAGIFKFFQDLLLFVSPQILKLMIDFTEDENIPDRQGYIYTVLLFVVAQVQSALLHQYFHQCNKAGLNVRTALIGAIYRKALRLSSLARKKSTVGEIVNLMSVDAQRFLDVMLYLHMVWSAPLQIILATFFLWQTMGASVMAGVGVMILLMPINGAIASILSKMQEKQMALKDQRIKMINEVLNGIKVVKLYAWENSFLLSISDLRRRELVQLRRISFLNAGITFTFSCAPFLVSVATFATYSLTGHNLTPAKAFVGISLFNILSFPLAMLPMLVMFLVEVRVSLKRILSFLQNDELDSEAVTRVDSVALDVTKDEDVVVVKNGNFNWSRDERIILQDIDIQVRRHSLVAVVGQVGAGKSSLLSALLGEMHKVSGQVIVQGSVAYVNQQAWIRNDTLKKNILFNKSVSERRYQSVLEACALKPDLEMLPGGDMTEIGEKGINLSGGQKQRVSMARAVYNNADVYLLDDPLSAVDAHVGEHIFNRVIGPEGLLKNKVRILVTHGLVYLPMCDQVIVMKDGQVSEVGTYSELMDRNGAFAEYLRTHGNEERDQTEQDGDDGCKQGQVERQESVTFGRQLSSVTEEKQDVKAENTLIEEEVSETGRVKFAILLDYARAAGVIVSISLLAAFAAVNAFAVASNVWLSKWSNDAKHKNTSHPVSFYLGIYSLFGVLQSVHTLLGAIFLAIGSIRASRIFHRRMLKTVLRAPMSFFDTTPLGRIVNRFSKDMYMIDEMIPESVFWCLFCFFLILGIIAVISYTTPVFLSVVLPIGVFYFFTQRFYVRTSRQVMRLESVSRSPIFSHFQETLAGTSTIRAYQQEERFVEENERRVDFNQIAYYPYMAGNRWLAVRLEFTGNCIVLFAALFAVIERSSLSGGLVGLSLSYALQCTENLNWFVRMTSELESKVVSVERVKEYAEIATEAPALIDSSRPPAGWPLHGQVCFNSYSVRYRPELDLVLRNIICSVSPGEKIGIVGRTGAGKSSLTLGLFRILEAAGGSITVDSVDIASIGLEDLRSRITIIPQDPVLFSGTLRLNLDPFNQHSDAELWNALENSHLRHVVEGLEGGLQTEIAEGGENLSVGQRQLVCLARALLRKSKVLVLDEATAAIDLETDSLIQHAIRDAFADCTVLTIAHRLHTIMDSDRVMVLDNGSVAEFDTPSALLEQSGIFRSMASAAGLVH